MIFWIDDCDLLAFRVGQDGEISARDVESDAAQRNFIFVGNNAADRLRITFVSVRAQYTAFPACRDAGLDLSDRCRVVFAKNLRLGFH